MANGVAKGGSTSKALVLFGPTSLPGDGLNYLASLRTASATVPTSYDTALTADIVNKCVKQ